MRPATRLRIVVLVASIALVEGLCRTGVIGTFTMIPPTEMALSLWRLLRSGRVQADIYRTLTAVAIAIGSSIVVGIVVGAAVHALPRLRRTVDPLLAAYYSVPVFVFYPMFIVMFGLNDIPKVMIGFLYAVAVMIINTLNGLDRVSPVLLKTVRVLRMGRTATAFSVVLPCAAGVFLSRHDVAAAGDAAGVDGVDGSKKKR